MSVDKKNTVFWQSKFNPILNPILFFLGWGGGGGGATLMFFMGQVFHGLRSCFSWVRFFLHHPETL